MKALLSVVSAANWQSRKPLLNWSQESLVKYSGGRPVKGLQHLGHVNSAPGRLWASYRSQGEWVIVLFSWERGGSKHKR